MKKCGVDIESDDGELIENASLFAFPEMESIVQLAVVYSSYCGLILYRINGHGRLPHDLFFNRATRIRVQMFFYAILVAMCFVTIILTQFNNMVAEQRIRIILFNFVPLFLLGGFGTYILPMTTSKLINYPLRIEDGILLSDDAEGFLREQTTLPPEVVDNLDRKCFMQS